jgi:hypothetical protein
MAAFDDESYSLSAIGAPHGAIRRDREILKIQQRTNRTFMSGMLDGDANMQSRFLISGIQ